MSTPVELYIQLGRSTRVLRMKKEVVRQTGVGRWQTKGLQRTCFNHLSLSYYSFPLATRNRNAVAPGTLWHLMLPVQHDAVDRMQEAHGYQRRNLGSAFAKDYNEVQRSIKINQLQITDYHDIYNISWFMIIMVSHGVSLSVIVSLWQLTFKGSWLWFRVHWPAACSSVALLAIHLHDNAAAANAAVKATGQVRPKSLPWPCHQHLSVVDLDRESSLLEQVELQKVDVIWRSCSHEIEQIQSNHNSNQRNPGHADTGVDLAFA